MIKNRVLLILLVCCSFFAASQEVCNNGIDDDGDGFTDLQDSECMPTIYPLLRNPSFEKITKCPDFYMQLQNAWYWLQPGPGANGSSDLYHSCGTCTYKFSGVSPNMPKPVPDGVGYVGLVDSREWMNTGIWKEYICTVPETELLKDSLYVLDFYLGFISPIITNPNSENFSSFSPVSFSVFGHQSAGAIPFATPNNNSYRNCPLGTDPGWVELGKITISGVSGQWVKARGEFKVPKNISAIVIGPSCEASPYGSNNHGGYYGIDQVLIYKKDLYDLPVINRSGDICGDTLVLTAVTNLPVAAGAWQWYREDKALPGETGAVLKLTRTQYGPGLYRVKLSVNQKTLLSPEAIVTIDDADFTLQDSLVFCGGTIADLNPQLEQEDAACGVTYLWSDGTVTPGKTFSAAGNFWFETTKNGCRKRDTVIVTVRPAQLVTLGPDTTLCPNESLVLSAGNPGMTYLWQDNSTGQDFLVTKPGTYKVKVSNGSCEIWDTLTVHYDKLPEISFSNDTILCKDEQKRLNPLVNGDRFLWNTGSTSPEITVTQPGTYMLEAENQCGITTNSIKVVNGICEFFMPSAFTPNKDNRNDQFGLGVYGFIRKYDCKVFNRWGQLVFSSANPAKHWDGNFKGVESPTGVYVWMVRYTDWKGLEHLKKGTVTLIR